MSEHFVQQIIDAREVSKDIALDIGSAEGRYINPLLVKFAEVYAFEADKADITKVAYRKDTFPPNVHVIDKAVSNKSGTVKLFMSDLNIGRHTINENHWKNQGKSWGYTDRYEEVEAITIDDICTGDKDVGFIKCDIEGGEALIFEGAISTLEHNLIDVVVELHEDIDFRSMTKIFTDLGYKIYTETGKSCDGMIHALFSNREQWEQHLPAFMERVKL
jgi:FkbM family methyltransferase